MTKTPIEIRNALIEEAGRLQAEAGSKPAGAGKALATFANLASEAELLRFADVIANAEPHDFWDTSRSFA